MMRGINHQNIFEDQEDYYQFLSTLDAMSQSYETDGLVNEPLSDDIFCLDIEDVSKGRPSDDQVMMLIKEKTGAPNSCAFQQMPDEVKRSVLIELKSRKASLRQVGKTDRNWHGGYIPYVMKQEPVPVFISSFVFRPSSFVVPRQARTEEGYR